MPQPRPPQAPSGPTRRPSSPSPPRLRGPLRLRPLRSSESVELDGRQARRGGEQLPPFVQWDHFYRDFQWEQGEHVTTIGPTGVGKTVLNRMLLRRRAFVVVLGVKQRDAELFAPFQREGYQLVRKFDPEPPDDKDVWRVLFVPTTTKHGTEGRQARARAFRQALNDIYDAGDWAVYCDDVQYLADQLRLAPELEELWILGRSEGVSVVVSSQEPVDIPLQAYGQATHLFLFHNPDIRRADRMAELSGINRDVVRETILRLPRHEFLYLNKNTGDMARSKVARA